MHKTECVVELEGEAISVLFEVLVEGLSILSEKGLKNEEEQKEYQRVIGVVDHWFEPFTKTAILSPRYIRALERLKENLQPPQE